MYVYVILNNDTKKTILEWDIHENDIARNNLLHI